MAKYKAAIAWIVDNDDTEWLNDLEPIISVTACMVADLFDKDQRQVLIDLHKETQKRWADNIGKPRKLGEKQ